MYVRSMSVNEPQTQTQLDELHAALRDADRAMAAAVATAAALDARAVIAAEGQTLASWLRTVVQRLSHLPTVRRWLATGDITYSVVRAIVYATRRLTVAQLNWVDDTLAHDAERIRRLDGDGLIGAVERLAGDARPDLEADRAQRLFERRHLQIQAGMDGSVAIYGEFDAEMGATIIAALDTTPTDDEPAPDAVHDTRDTPGDEGHHERHVVGDDHAHDAGTRSLPPRRGRGQLRADALHALCLQRGGRASDRPEHVPAPDDDPTDDSPTDDVPSDEATPPAPPSRGSAPAHARPSVLVMTDVATLAGVGAGDPRVTHMAELLWRATRGPVRLTGDALERVTCHGDLRPLLVDGAVPLGVAAPTTNVGAPLRAALLARDGTCRFPGCHHPGDACDNHHIVHRLHGGPTTLENLALLCPAHHRAVHEGGWRPTLHDDATMTFRRRGRELTTLPFAQQRARPSRPPPRGRPRRASSSPSATRESPIASPPASSAPPAVDLPF
jgi:hypothetical protein